MFSNIIWATDGSEHADRALEYATQLARSEGAELHAVHVVETLLGPRVAGQPTFVNEHEIEEKIKRQVAALADEPGVNATLHMTADAPQNVAKQITAIADETGADLIIVGTRGHSAIAGVMLGSVTQRLLHVAHRPLLAIPPADATSAARETAETVSAAR